MGDSVAVLLRVPERRDQPADLEERCDVARTRMAAATGLDGVSVEPPDRRNRRLPPGAGKVRAAAASAWRGRSRRPDRGYLHRTRGGGPTHPVPRFLAVPGTPHPRPASSVVAVEMAAGSCPDRQHPACDGGAGCQSVGISVEAARSRPHVVRRAADPGSRAIPPPGCRLPSLSEHDPPTGDGAAPLGAREVLSRASKPDGP